MKKNFFHYSLMAALMCGLSMGFTACSDSDSDNHNDGNSNDENNSAVTDTEVMNAEQTDEAIKAWSWVSVLTDETEQTDNWASKTYTATIGEPSSNNEMARLIYVSNLDEAKESFASIVGCDPNELVKKKTITAGQYGSMVWNVSLPSAPNIATVDVNSSLLPNLQQIIYCTEDQAPDNASDITGNCYYRLGDVIEDADGYYWVCVQPSFQGKKFKDSYWINVFNANPETGKGVNTGKTPGIPEKNIYSKYNGKYNGNTIQLPTNLKTDRKQNFNFANLIGALIHPTYFEDQTHHVATSVAGLPFAYHNASYMEVLCEGWKKEEISEKLFNCSYDDLRDVQVFHFFYHGYHWKVGSTAGVWIYSTDCYYQQEYAGSLDTDDTLFEMKKAGYGFDVRRYAGDPNENKECASKGEQDMAPAKQFFTDSVDKNLHGYWVIRMATGKQLDKNYDPYQAMKNVYTIYSYNQDNKIPVGPDRSPLSADSDDEGDDGDF